MRLLILGTGGMAKLLGLDVREDSVFGLRDGKLQGLRYDYRQDAALTLLQRVTADALSGGH